MKLLTAAALVLCIGSATAGHLWPDVCSQPDVAQTSWCDTKRPVSERAAAFVAALHPDEKIPLLTNEATGVPRLHVPPYQWGSEGLHGPMEPCVCAPGGCACPTSFPAPAATGSSFNTTLFKLIGEYDGVEARAINNLRNHATQNNYGDGLDYWSPTLNMQRDPRWGRNQEVPGEDPTLTSVYAAQFVQGLQGAEASTGGASSVTIAACCKHFVANSLENWYNYSRHNFDAPVPTRDLVDYYLPSFKSCVMEGKARGVMCSYNAVNGVPMCANPTYLNHTLRSQWKFDGYVTSDCDAVGDISTASPDGHGFATPSVAAALALKAGTDMDCGDFGRHAYTKDLPGAVSAGLASQGDLDRALLRLTSRQMELGLFDPKQSQPLFQLGLQSVRKPEHTQLALEAARQSVTLLVNAGGTLPLSAGQKIAVVGPHSNGTEVFVSSYHGSSCLNSTGGVNPDGGFGCIQTPHAAIAAANVGGVTTSSIGCEVDSSLDLIEAAVTAAKRADVVVLVAGIDKSQEAEQKDRYNTTLPGLQPKLLSALLGCGTPVVLVVVHGGAVSLGRSTLAALDDPSTAHALVDAPYGGEMAAQAIADVLFGVYNPTGRLTHTVYPPEFVDQIPLTDMSLTSPPGRTYMYYTGQPEHQFGDGLSYSSFEVSFESLPNQIATTTPTTTVEFAVNVRNLGAVAGGIRVLGFWSPKNPLESAPELRRKMFGFDGITALEPGETSTLLFSLPVAALAMSNENGQRVVSPGEYEVSFKATTDTVLKSPLVVTGPGPVVVESYQL